MHELSRFAVGAGLRLGGTATILHLAARDGVPAGATAVLNLTVTEPTAAGYVTVYPCGIDAPLASNLNFSAGQTIPMRSSPRSDPSVTCACSTAKPRS